VPPSLYSPLTTVTNFIGRFLLAQLHMASLSTKPNRKAVREALEKLPEQLDSTYDEVMRRIENQNSDDRKIAQRVLGWISFAKRPLSLLELQHALATEPRTESFDEDNVMDQELITSTCAGLVFVDEESNIVRLVHYSTQEYFARHCHELFPTAEREISEVCLTYLMFQSEPGSEGPFHSYALEYLGAHIRGDLELTLQDMVIPCLWTLQKKINKYIKPTLLTPLSVALVFGCTARACTIIDELCASSGTLASGYNLFSAHYDDEYKWGEEDKQIKLPVSSFSEFPSLLVNILRVRRHLYPVFHSPLLTKLQDNQASTSGNSNSRICRPNTPGL
jgi:hypothetical protein